MKKHYYLGLLAILLCANFLTAQTCPPSIGNQSTTTEIVFKITSGTCGDYSDPTILINTTIFSFDSCSGTNLRYVYDSGPALSSSDTFTVFFGFPGGICQYVNGDLVVLGTADATLNESVSIFPNPIIKQRHFTLKFATPLSGDIAMYDVTGKLALRDQVNNASSKELNTSGLTNGIYFLKLDTHNASMTRKIIISN